MILDSLRDRHPDMFAPKTKAAAKLAKRLEREARRRRDVNKTRGTGKARIWNVRLVHYIRGLTALVFHKEIQARLAADPQFQLASTGGVEATNG